MKKIIPVLFGALLVWNLILTFRLVDIAQNTSDGKTVINNTIDGYTTDITATVHEAEKYVVDVMFGEKNYSGVIVESSGNDVSVLTCSEVSDAEVITVMFDSGAREAATLKGSDPESGLALLNVEVEYDVEAIKLGDSELINKGEYVIGMSGKHENGNSEISFGVSSEEGFYAFHNSSYLCGLLTSDMTTCENQYGGAMLNLGGELIGILCKDPQLSSAGMSYAISVNEAKKIYKELSEDQQISRGSLGIAVRSVKEMESYEKNQNGFDLDIDSGLFVTSVPEGSCVYGSIFEGDLITKIDTQPMEDVEDYKNIIYKKSSGDEVEVVLERNGESLTLNVVLQ